VDMSMSSMEMSGQPMSGGSTSGGSMQMSGGEMSMMGMAGMVSMPGSNSFPVKLSAWKNGKHTLTVQPVQNDHTEIHGAKPATITINLEGAATS
jgi:hypothetical protein